MIEIKLINNGKQGILLKKIGFENFVVPKGFMSDFATIPRIFWCIYPPLGAGRGKNYAKACILHDYLYSKECDYLLTRKECDLVFKRCMKYCNVTWFTRNFFYVCVRIFAKSHFRV